MAFGLIESYNRTRYVEELLEKVDGQSPSFTVHLHPEYWVLNNGSKFLYHNQIASLLDDIRAHRIPVDFLELFDNAHVPFYDGCMVVELLDYRAPKFNQPQPEKPERTRVILHPNPETLYADICTLNQRSGGTWSDREAVEVESKLLLATTPPLCLDPNPHLTRVANHVLRASTPTIPMSLKRKAAVLEHEEDESEKFRKRRIMSYGVPSNPNRKQTPSYNILDALHRFRKEKEAEAENPLPTHPYLLGPPPRPPLATTSPSPAHVFKKDPSVPPPPAQPSLQFVPQQPPPPPAAVNPAMQPRVYASVQASTEAAAASAAAAHRTPTPAMTPAQQQQQHQYQLQQLQKAQQQQQQTIQASPKVPSVLPQPIQTEQPRPTPTPKPNVTPSPIQPAATSSGGPYPNQQFLMQVSQQPSQQHQQATPVIQQPHAPQQPNTNQLIAHYQAEAAKLAVALKAEPNNEHLKAQLIQATNNYHRAAQGKGRATPQTIAASGQAPPAAAMGNMHQHAGQQQQGQQNGQPQQQHPGVSISGQHYPQQVAQTSQNPQQPQQLGTGQFTFTANFPQRSAVTPSQAHMVAVAHANQAKANAGTPVPGGVPIQHSPQHQPPQQHQQHQQHQLQQQHLQQQLQTPQVQHQQIRTPQMRQQQLGGTPQMQAQQLRTPQVQPQQIRTPQMQQQQLQVPQQQHAQMQRQPTPQVNAQQQQHIRQMAQAHAQAQPQQQQQAMTIQQQQIRMAQLQQMQQIQAAQAQQRNGQPVPAQQQHQQQQMQQYLAYQRAVAEGKIPQGMTPAQVVQYQQYIMNARMAAGQQQHPNAVQAQAIAAAQAQAQAQAHAQAQAANVAGGNPMIMQGSMPQSMQAMQANPALMAAMRQQQQQQILMQQQNQQRQQ